MSTLQRALKELESATAAVVAAHIENFADAKAAMDRRQWAIADVAELAQDALALSAEEREDALNRLRLAAESGSRAQARLNSARGAAIAEWAQWSRIYQTLSLAGASKSSLIDCCG